MKLIPPLYSYFLAGVFLLGGKYQVAVFVAQTLLGSFAAFIFYISITKVLDGAGGLLASLFFALFPHFLLFTKQILTEPLYIPLWIFLLACLLFLKDKQDMKYFFGAGISLGLLALTRREAIFLGSLMLLMLFILYDRSGWKKIFQKSAMVLGLAGLLMLPWLIRNYYVLGQPVLSSSGGINFMVGNNPLGNGAYTPPPREWQAQFQGLTEFERDQKAWDLSLDWIQANPVDFLNLLPKKLLVLWGPAHNLALDGADIFLMIACLPGFIRVLQRQDDWKIIGFISLLPVLTTTLISLVFVGGWRYRLIVYPGLFLLAGYGVAQVSSWYFFARYHLQSRNHAIHS